MERGTTRFRVIEGPRKRLRAGIVRDLAAFRDAAARGQPERLDRRAALRAVPDTRPSAGHLPSASLPTHPEAARADTLRLARDPVHASLTGGMA